MIGRYGRKKAVDNGQRLEVEPHHLYTGCLTTSVVVPKRAALLFDQLMVALQKVVDNQNRENLGSSRSFSRSSPRLSADSSQIVSPADEQTVKMDLQRRGQPKGRVYWRCYFNAVTCFKRK
ncbi:uncharacterized protein LOC100875099 isoform X2 [Megachile rotundata]|uniref:uncharacterized protein LOC100875099 isoform X2 n=1 Tax=Megachile rotundata TaxID=143995 RepID=UPI003FD5B56F